ncbi:pirin family protein [Aldersonia kunmingensis]|uniref:pirin family protein n=1 Tax=Aldersonia kunmingensis TaxID=408066 RepID=UPI00082A85EE|nr:pirin family protein [Aldersonia kunmingensis]
MTDQNRTGRVVDLGQPWRGIGPFLFAAYHHDDYPRGDGKMAPAADLSGRPLGGDFGNPAGWNMYHGNEVPGFPAHPHRGFETITIVREGIIDHADSTGASARYGPGDVQWVTAGRGVSHSEMFPLLREDAGNPFEIYQVWLNLPARDKMADPEFTMQWNEDVPVLNEGEPGTQATVRVIAGAFRDVKPLAPPSHSWASDPAADVAVWVLDLDPHASIELPATNRPDTRRLLYLHGDGARLDIDGATVESGQGYEQTMQSPLTIRAGERPVTGLLLQGAEIGEPVVAHGPFVMNSASEIDQAFADYRRTQFGVWPWSTSAPVHPPEAARFALYGDGRVEQPEQPAVTG